MKRKIIFLVCILAMLIGSVIYINNRIKGAGILEFNPPNGGAVPDELTAIKIAEAFGQPIFGKNLKDYKPFHAELRNDSIWFVYGLPKKSWVYVQMGGTPNFEIHKGDGKLLKAYLSR